MIIHSIRILFFFVIVAASTLIGSTGFTAEGGYADNRARADLHPKTMAARSYFHAQTPKLFEASKKKYRVNNLQLVLDTRLIAQYGRGKDSANDVLPKELDQIVKFISQARYQKAELIKQVMTLKSLGRYKRQDIEKAIAELARVKVIRLDSWGYIVKVDEGAVYKQSRNRMTYYAKWIERTSHYELYSEAAMKSRIIRGIITELNSPSWGPW